MFIGGGMLMLTSLIMSFTYDILFGLITLWIEFMLIGSLLYAYKN